jgi:hypothetical protein
MPGSEPTLYVTGTCTFPTTGYSVTLKPVEPTGIPVPNILQLQYIVREPEGVTQPVVTEVKASYSKDTDIVYTEVQIFPDNIRVPVQEVS